MTDYNLSCFLNDVDCYIIDIVYVYTQTRYGLQYEKNNNLEREKGVTRHILLIFFFIVNL